MTSLRRGSFWVAVTLTFTVALASVFGQGVMPSRASDGTFTIVLCTDGGLIEVDAATLDPAHPADNGRTPDPCAWAAAHAPMTGAPSPPAVLAVAAEVSVAVFPTAAPDAPRSLRPQGHSARGPPLSA